MTDKGFIALHRKLLNNPVVCKDADHLAVWIWLLLNAVWDKADVVFGGERITLGKGQLTTGRKLIASELHISESKVQRILKRFEIEHQIEQRTDHQCRLITIVSWEEYQDFEQRNEQRVNNERTTSEQRVNTNKQINKVTKEQSNKVGRFIPPSVEEVEAYIQEKNYHVDAEQFINFYESKGWYVGKNKMKSWKACIATWEKRHKDQPKRKSANPFEDLYREIAND